MSARKRLSIAQAGLPRSALRLAATHLSASMLLLGLLLGSALPAVAATVSYQTPGTYRFAVPAGVTQLDIEVSGGGGGGGGSSPLRTGGKGGNAQKITGNAVLTPGQVLIVIVGGGGAGGMSEANARGGAGGVSDWAHGGDGGKASSSFGSRNLLSLWSGSGGGGGGASSVKLDAGNYGILVAAGGGGGGNGSAAGHSGLEGGVGGNNLTRTAKVGANGFDFGGGGGGGGAYLGGSGGKGARVNGSSQQFMSGGGSGDYSAGILLNRNIINGGGAPGGGGASFNKSARAANGADGWVTIAYPDSSLEGRVFKDDGRGGGVANDGILNGAEAGIGGVSVALTRCGGDVLSTTTTDSRGNYSLLLPAAGGALCVRQVNAAGDLSTGASVNALALPSDTPIAVAAATTYTYARSADEVAFTAAASVNYTGVNFGDISPARFTADARQRGRPGGELQFAHAFVASSAGSVSFAASGMSSSPEAAWSEQIYLDADCNAAVDRGERPITTALTVSAGSTVCIVLKQSIPLDLNGNAWREVTLSASQNYDGAHPALSQRLTVTDLTTLDEAQVLLEKKVRNVTRGEDFGIHNSARSGETLEYRITYTNTSAQAITGLFVADTTPAHTRFVSASAGPLPASLSACSKKTPAAAGGMPCASADVAGGHGPISWSFSGSLAPAQSGTVSFQVRID
jgi:uncharacterized repeat protein (TIGR01451 family)